MTGVLSPCDLATPSVPPAAAPRPRRSRPRPANLAHLADHDLTSRTEAELIAHVLAGPGPAVDALRCGRELARIPLWHRRSLGIAGLIEEHGVAPERAVRLAALWELAERWYPDDRPAVQCSRDALLVLEDLRLARSERIVVLLLDARHRPLRRETVAVGALNASRLQPRDVLAPALRVDAAALLIAHNHPSGDPAPSRADRQVTSALRAAAEVVGVRLLDHLILARHGHHSFREAEGWESDPAANGS
jgi:DNA repair protein RadC